MRNSSLVKRSCADNSTGLKPAPDAAGVQGNLGAVGEHSAIGGRRTGRTAGRGGSEDAGTSSDQDGENPSRRKPKGSWGRLIRPGLVGPKPRPRGVGEGQQVNIPGPAGSDEREVLSGLIGLPWLLDRSGKQLQRRDRTRNRHRWTGRVYQGA